METGYSNVNRTQLVQDHVQLWAVITVTFNQLILLTKNCLGLILSLDL
jgi:hypothetical protein